MLAPGAALDGPTPVYGEQSDAELRDTFRFLEESMLAELGIRLPELVWIPAPSLPESCFAFKINSRLGPPLRGLQPGELLVNGPAGQLGVPDITGRPAFNPGAGAVHAIVPEEHKARLEGAGYTTWTPFGFLILALASEIRATAERLLSVEDTEYNVAQLEPAFPQLVRIAAARLSLQELTRVLRGLLREGLSIGNVRAILERLLQYDTIAADADASIVFDDRLVVEDGRPTGTVDGWSNCLAFLRQGLRHYLGYKYGAGTDTPMVYLLDRQIGRLLTPRHALRSPQHAPRLRAGVDEAAGDAILDAVWAQVAHLPATAQLPGIVTAAGNRPALRELLAAELPRMFVIAYEELPPEVNMQPIDRIALKI